MNEYDCLYTSCDAVRCNPASLPVDMASQWLTVLSPSFCPIMKPVTGLLSQPLSVHLHAQLSRITAIVRLCYSIRQLQLSEYTCRWEKWIIGRSMSYAGTIGGVVPISNSGNRATSSWPLHVTSNNKLPQHSRKMACEDKATSLYNLYMVYLIITKTRCTIAAFLAVISEERCCCCRPSTSGSWLWERNLAPAQNAKSDPIWWNVYMQE